MYNPVRQIWHYFANIKDKSAESELKMFSKLHFEDHKIVLHQLNTIKKTLQ